jgi:hypothetical protein
MATNSFFFGETPSPEANTVDQLIDSLNVKLQEATAAQDSASTSATSASNSADNAAASATSSFDAATQSVTASNEANNFSTAASLSASEASASQAAALASANAASLSQDAALTSETNAAASEANALAVYDLFDDRYLGVKATDPTVDNDGNALLDGALYFDTTLNVMKVYDLGNTVWVRTTPTTADQANINTVTTNVADVNTVASSIANVNTTAGSITNVNTTATNIANVNTVAGISGNVTTVATNNANVTTVASNIGSVNTVAGISSDIATVVTNITDIQNAEENADAAALSASAASSSASAASTSASQASTSATQASTSATNASTSASQASTSATSAANSATTATTKAGEAATSATNAATSATNAATSASSSASSASSASSSASSASTSATAAASSYDQFDDRYLGSKATPPSSDNDGQPLLTGALYYNSASSSMNVWNGSAWEAAYIPVSGYAPLSNPAFTGEVTENGLPIVSQADIGTAPNEIPLNQYLGSLAYQDLESVTIDGGVATLDTATITSIQNDTAISNVEPSLMLNFAQVKKLDPRITYARASTATYYNQNGVLQTAPSGVARFDHNPTTTESLGLLIEEQRTNLLTYSEDYTNVAWTKSNATVTADTIVAPDGTLTGDLLSVVSSGRSYILSSANTASNTVLSGSIFVKAGNQNNVCLTASIGNVGVRQWFNLATATSGSTISLSGGVKTSSEITSIGNDWYRISLSMTASAGVIQYLILDVVTGDNVLSGNSGDNVYIWGAQLEAGAFPTSYIPTVASQVTRSADSASMTGANFSSWYRQDEGTVYVESQPISLTAQGHNTAGITDGSSSNAFYIQMFTASNVFDYAVANVGTIQAVFSTGVAPVPNVDYKNAFAYKTNDFAASFNGGAIQTDTLGIVPPNMNTLAIGNLFVGSSQPLTGHIKKISYFPARLSNEELQEMTS